MKNTILIAFSLAILIPVLFGNFWFVAVTGFLVETAVEPLFDKLLNSIGPD